MRRSLFFDRPAKNKQRKSRKQTTRTNTNSTTFEIKVTGEMLAEIIDVLAEIIVILTEIIDI